MDRQERIEKAVVELDGDPRKASSSDIGIIRTVLLLKYERYSWASEDSSAARGCFGHTVICTYPEFMEARKRLENKPSWDDAPEEYEWRWQNGDGTWKFGRGHKPRAMNDAGGYYQTTYHSPCIEGRCFGDWRQSLERRPESKPDKETLNPEAQQAEAWLKVCETLGEVCPNWLDLDSRAEDCAVLAIEGLAERSPFANNEHHDHKEGEGVKWDPGFDLPPIGAWVVPVSVDDPVEVICYGKAGKFCGRCEEGFIGIFDGQLAEPVKSHRDKVIEAAMKVAKEKAEQHDGFTDCRRFAEALFAAGLLNEKRGDQ